MELKTLMTPHTFAIIGCGRIAQRHAKHISTMGKLVAVCDIRAERADAFGATYGCRTYSDLTTMLAAEQEVEVVSVCTPNGLHAEHSIAALEAGHHVLCEKPMAISTRDCDRMIDASLRTGRHLFVVKQNRLNPPVVAVKNALAMGKLGRINNVQLNCFWNRNAEYYKESDWKGGAELDGGTLYTQFSHFIDLLLWMVGEVETFQYYDANFLHRDLIDFEDSGVVILRFLNGALGTINYTVNSFAKNMEGSLTLFGDKGTVKIGGQYLNVLEYQQFEDYCIVGIKESAPANDYGHYQGSMSNHDLVYKNILDVLDGHSTIGVSGIEGRKSVALIEQLYRTARNADGRTAYPA